MGTGRTLAAVGLGVIVAMALALLITRNASLDLAVSEFPAPEPTPTPVLTPIPAGTAAFRFAQRYDAQTNPIGAGYQAATNTERFQASEFAYATAPLHAGNLVVPLCLLVDGHPWVRYAVAAPHLGHSHRVQGGRGEQDRRLHPAGRPTGHRRQRLQPVRLHRQSRLRPLRGAHPHGQVGNHMLQGAMNIGARDRAIAAGLMLVALAALVYATQVLPSLAPLHPVIPAPYSALSRFLALLLIVPFAALVLRGRGRSGGASVTSAPIMALALVFNHLLPSLVRRPLGCAGGRGRPRLHSGPHLPVWLDPECGPGPSAHST